MRIISGHLKGKSIAFTKISNTRPLKDSVKENIFNILLHSSLIGVKIYEADILDLYSGIGSFGLEAISRGAKKVTFIEKNEKAVKLLKENLNNFEIQNKASVIEDEIEEVLKKKKLTKYNIFFLDPPFSNNNFINIIFFLKKLKIYKKNNLVIIHREKNSNDDFKDMVSVIFTKIYGRSKIIFAHF